MAKKPRIKTVKTVFDVFEKVIEQNGASATELTESLEISNSTIHDYLRSLEEVGYLINDCGYYYPSTKILNLGGEIRDNFDVFHASKAKLDDLSKKTGKSTFLMVPEFDYGVFLYGTEGEYQPRSVPHVGTHTMLHTTALGKAILAHLSPEQVENIIKKYSLPARTEKTITDKKSLFEELVSIRDKGYATEIGESRIENRGIAVPLMGHRSEELLGSIAIYVPTANQSSRESEFWITESSDLKLLFRTADIIEHELEYK